MRQVLLSLFLLLFLCETTLLGETEKPARLYSEKEALERLFSIEFHRMPQETFLKGALYHPSKRVVRQTLLTLGRMGDPNYIEALLPVLQHGDVDQKRAAAFALSLIGGSMPLALLSQHAQLDKNPATRAELWLHIGRMGDEKTLVLFRNALNNESSPKLIESICHGLTHLWTQADPKWDPPQGLIPKLLELTLQPDPVGYAAAYALSRYPGPASLIPLASLLPAVERTPSKQGRALLIKVLGKQNSEKVTEALIAQKGSTVRSTREAVARALANQTPGPTALATLSQLLNDPFSSVRVNALETAQTWGASAQPLGAQIEALYKGSHSTWVRGYALSALVACDPVRGKPHLEILLSQTDSPLLVAGVKALGVIKSETSLDRLFNYLASPDTRVAKAAAEAIAANAPQTFTDPQKEGLKAALKRGDVALTFILADLIEKNSWDEFAPTLREAYAKLDKREQLEAKVAIIKALQKFKDKESQGLFEKALSDPDREVALAAASAIETLTGKAPTQTLPRNSQLGGLSPTYDQVQGALRSRVRIDTRHGSMVWRFLEEAPLNAYQFVQLARQKFFDGKTFHRVVPHFVAQGGDPRGDGFGGPGYFVRDEVSPRVHALGTVGLATAGKDTGGSQFFINLADNLHLDGKYTQFAEIVTGVGVAERLEVGDVIMRAQVLP